MYNYAKSINCYHTPQIIYIDVWKKNNKKYTHKKKYLKKYKCIESVLTSLSDSCISYLLIDERTGSSFIEYTDITTHNYTLLLNQFL